ISARRFMKRLAAARVFTRCALRLRPGRCNPPAKNDKPALAKRSGFLAHSAGPLNQFGGAREKVPWAVRGRALNASNHDESNSPWANGGLSRLGGHARGRTSFHLHL